jgi:hypothetical protein
MLCTPLRRLALCSPPLLQLKDAQETIPQELEAELMLHIMQLGLGIQRATSLSDLDGCLKARRVKNEVTVQDWILSGVVLGVQLSHLIHSCVAHSCTAESCHRFDVADGWTESLYVAVFFFGPVCVCVFAYVCVCVSSHLRIYKRLLAGW